jgi:hypothetical protein
MPQAKSLHVSSAGGGRLARDLCASCLPGQPQEMHVVELAFGNRLWQWSVI